MFSHRTLSFLVLAVFMVEELSALTTDIFSLIDRIDNRGVLTKGQQNRILNLTPDQNGKVRLHKDCKAINRFEAASSGIYIIQPSGSVPFVVYCDMDTKGGGWVVLQRVSKNSATPFARHWNAYKYTFGNMEHDHWLGNEYAHRITKKGHYEVKFVVESSLGKVEVDYASFNVENVTNKYKLRLGSPIGNSESYDYLTNFDKTGSSDNMMFSARDEDNDRDARNCADVIGGGWWFNQCSNVYFNDHQIHWQGICDDCLSATILIRPSFENCK
ncbi:fibrinogen-like protein 1-like protein [Scyliorhinus canicula]|uniref:fibrinogen-like protein 1-like protein n=1 Tax=Scyliorhinus canicula TaxID=7830 RepID=UPI0018F546C4|nr:fibrinogen-like protein 1-like protein [Scyliorhinus canicula]